MQGHPAVREYTGANLAEIRAEAEASHSQTVNIIDWNRLFFVFSITVYARRFRSSEYITSDSLVIKR
jgi:hypothetical protein